jgi:lipoprotein NlpI
VRRRTLVAGALAAVVLLMIAIIVISTSSGSIDDVESANIQPASFYNDRGDKYYASDLYDLALLDYSKAIALEPENADAFNGRGKVYHAQKNEEELAEHKRH